MRAVELLGCKVIINTQSSLKEVLNKGKMKLSRLLRLKKFFFRVLWSLFEGKFVLNFLQDANVYSCFDVAVLIEFPRSATFKWKVKTVSNAFK